MTVLGLVLRYRLFTILALPLVWLEAVLRAAWPTKQLVFANFARTVLDAARAGSEGVWGRKF